MAASVAMAASSTRPHIYPWSSCIASQSVKVRPEMVGTGTAARACLPNPHPEHSYLSDRTPDGPLIKESSIQLPQSRHAVRLHTLPCAPVTPLNLHQQQRPSPATLTAGREYKISIRGRDAAIVVLAARQQAISPLRPLGQIEAETRLSGSDELVKYL